MKNALVNEIHHADHVEWSVSVDGFNTPDSSQTVICKDSAEAFKLKGILDDLKEKLDFVVTQLKPRIEDKITPFKLPTESEITLGAICEEIELLYL